MARQVEMEGPTVNEAVGRALLKLGLEREAVDVEVVAEPRKGIFGSKPAVVVVREKEPRGDALPESDAPVVAPPSSAPPQHSSARPDEEALVTDTDTVATDNAQLEEALTPEERLNQLDEEADMAADFVEGLLDRLDLPGDIEIEITEEQALLNLEDVGSGLLIGRRGATLDALQELVRCAVQRQTERRSRVRVDVEGYRARHVEKLRDRCREAIAQVRETGQPVRLEPMDAYERKLMHDLVSKTGGVTSSSEGTEPKRRVVIHPEA